MLTNFSPFVPFIFHNFHFSFSLFLLPSSAHMGGSCQFSVSYDQGVTFAVLTSIIGGCPLSSTYTIPIPQLPSAAKALFAWTWYNHDGNREEYSNCAVVNSKFSNFAYEKKIFSDVFCFLSRWYGFFFHWTCCI